MQTNTLREKLHQYVDSGDAKLVKLLYTLAKEYNEEDDEIDSFFTANDIQLFDERREKRIAGESKTYNWEEAKAFITANAIKE
jgi:hypothetical protein